MTISFINPEEWGVHLLGECKFSIFTYFLCIYYLPYYLQNKLIVHQKIAGLPV